MNLCSFMSVFLLTLRYFLRISDQEVTFYLKLKYFARNNLLQIKGFKK